MNDEVITTKTYSKNKAWLVDTSEKEEVERATVEQDCEQEGSGNDQQYFTMRHTRGIDEGQTVFYECTKCGFTEAQNT